MRILANENVPGDAVEALRNVGYDVVWAREHEPGRSDIEILTQARQEKRVLVTFDKDCGELAFRLRMPSVQGIILFRISAPSSAHVASKIVEALQSRSDWHGCFSVVEDSHIRMTALPSNQ